MSYEAEDTLKDPGTTGEPDADVQSPGSTDDESGSGAGDTGRDEDDAAG
ncbi:MAG: hypothetical protein ACLGI5_08955 [Thermoleophilia bacterium]